MVRDREGSLSSFLSAVSELMVVSAEVCCGYSITLEKSLFRFITLISFMLLFEIFPVKFVPLEGGFWPWGPPPGAACEVAHCESC